MEPGSFIVLAIIAAVVIRLIAGGMDYGRVQRYIESMNGELIDVRWSPFGPGWFGEKSDRIYEVRYFDRDRNEHHAYCKTSLWTGVYLTQDDITFRAKTAPGQPAASLEEDNRRLREELDRLRSKQA